MRTSNLLAEQVAELMERDGGCAAAWQGKVVQRWIEPMLRLLASVGHNRDATCRILAVYIEVLQGKIDAAAKNPKHDAGKAQTERRTKVDLYGSLLTELQSVCFLVYMSHLRDTLTCLQPLSLEGQEQAACAALISFSLASVKQDLQGLQTQNGPYTQAFLASATVNNEAKAVHLDGQQLSTQKANTGWPAAKQLRHALLKEISHIFENQLYVDMAVADPRCWTANTVTDSEKQSVVAVEERYGKAVPGLIGAWHQFGKAKEIFFASSKEEQEKACTASGFLLFWSAVVSNKQFAMCLRLYAAIIVLACPSSADAERAISALNSIAIALRSSMSWDSIRIHLIGKQDTLDPQDFLVASVASAWAAAKSGDRRRFQTRKHKTPSDKGKKRKVLVVQTCDDSGDDNALQEFCMAANAPAADSSSSSSGASSSGDVVSSSSSSSDSSSAGSADTDGSELQAILAKCVKK